MTLPASLGVSEEKVRDHLLNFRVAHLTGEGGHSAAQTVLNDVRDNISAEAKRNALDVGSIWTAAIETMQPGNTLKARPEDLARRVSQSGNPARLLDGARNTRRQSG